jgi:hypothetical protein
VFFTNYGALWCQCLEVYSKGVDNVAKYLRFEVDDGSHIRFWHDLWCGDKPIKLCYPVLYSIARSPDAWVVDNLSVVWEAWFIKMFSLRAMLRIRRWRW